MATIRKRERKDGSAIFQVRWIQGGRGGTSESEPFADEDSAKAFKRLVDAHGQKWPHGWLKGRGFVEEPVSEDDVPLLDWAHRYVNRLTGIDPRTRDDYAREVDQHFTVIRHALRSGRTVQPTIGNITADDITDWVRAEEDGERDPEDPKAWLRRPASPKSIANRHGLLWCIVQAAVEADPQLRTTNCCTGTRLPRADDHTVEEMVFLERDEYARVAAEITDPGARLLADWLVGTGMRWGEASALQVRDLKLTSSTPTASVQRAWKKAPKGSDKSFFLGPPKTRKARRLVALSPSQVDVARRLVEGQHPEAFVFRTAWGNAWRHSNFYHRKWQPAGREAVAKGLPRAPRIHDLRHTHVAWLIAARIPLPAIRTRLGHESIQTTVDRYGHLVSALDGEITAAVEAAMAPEVRQGLRVVDAG
ncbi:site-specific integrase [Streptomyces sp. 549]|uniref:tyrosine-type recombinase/integrase n=1 Tax=Streptomyces sp. 549 TaxID=3049076 RepID=UPI0024C2EE93|nr:site-specific integrase [Streptomyces sp. 549]MDK1473693.1 site-specific integrase [Streptomyces sp. 549]